VELDPDEQVVVTAGAQDALGCALLGLLDTGDEVVFIEPFYNPCVPVARRAGATLRFVALRAPDFRLDEDELMAAMSERTKLIVYNSPNNPSGRVLSRSELEMIARACERFDAYLIADEVYEHLVFAGHEHVSAFDIPTLAERACVVSSFSKTYLMTGWRIGWAMGARPLIAAINRMHQLMSFCVPAFLCEGVRFALEDLPSSYLEEFVALHQAKRDRLIAGLGECGLTVLPPEGTFFLGIDIAELDAGDDVELCLRLPEEAGVAAVPMSLSWSDRREGRQLIRLCFSKTDETLDQAVRSFQSWMENRA
jgi:N-succinyldiaminopimelate aminotransferase